MTVQDTLPAGLTATGLGGTGWSCTLASLTCTRSDALAAGASYPAITLTVDVAANAGSPLINSVTVAGGGDSDPANNSASDSATVTSQLGIPMIGRAALVLLLAFVAILGALVLARRW